MKKSFIYISICLLFSSCFKKEDPYFLPETGATTSHTEQLRLGAEYENIYFYSLFDSSYKQAMLFNWDISLEAASNGSRIFLNGGKGYVAAVAKSNLLSDVLNIDSLTFKWDVPSGNIDSTACGNWYDGNNKLSPVFVIDRGASVKKPERYLKFQIELSGDQYLIRSSFLEEKTTFASGTVEKDTKVNKIYFSIIDNKEIIGFEPTKEDWDIQFTRYNHVYFDMNPVVSYIVNGVLLNPNKVQAFKNTSQKYEDIQLIDTMSGEFTSKQDVIGFDWKYYNIDKALYSITPNNVYIIRSVKGLYYKLRFIDFYDENKQKGNPTFQYELLK